ncbi:MAG: oligopeptide transporter substrate-binding protein, partial [Firmicutes bacterium]|nr:oligopeptide transporter substrate-binding protein [Bacillota bacterium]
MIQARKVSMGIGVLLTAAVMLSACGPKQGAQTPTPTPGGTTTPVSQGKPAVGGEINLLLTKDPDNFNPILSSTSYGAYIHTLVYAHLFEFNEKFEPTPYVAESWKASDDGLTWTIKIKQGIKFHDGNDLTADDVVFTLKSIMDKDYTGPRSSSVTSIKEITAPDKYTVKIDLKEQFAPILTDINYGILEKKLFEGTPVKDFDKNPATMKPVGAGPYKFVEYKRGQYITLERNDNWFMSKELGGAPFIQTLRWKVIPESATAEAALESGELDWMTPEAKDVANLEANFKAKLTPVDYERNGWGYMNFNVSRPQLADKRVRQALTYGLDRQSIITGVLDGRAVIPAGPIPSVSWAFDPSLKPAPYDKAKAKQLLEEAGYKMNASTGIYEKDGQPLKLTFYGTTGSSTIEGIAAIAKKSWKEIGVDLDVQLIDFNAMMDNFLKPGKFDISFAGFSLGLDPDQYTLFHSSQVTGFNRGRYNNPEIDKLLEAGRKESDPAKRKAIYADYQKRLMDDP